MIKFLLNAYHNLLSPSLASSETLKKYNKGELLLPQDLDEFIQILSQIQKYCFTEDLFYRIAAIRKYVGNGQSLKGLLNILSELGHETFLISYELGSIGNIQTQVQKTFRDFSDLRIIAPLNLDENEEIYSFCHKQLNLPVYPLTFNLLASKWAKNFTFAPYVTRAFYFPEGTYAQNYLKKVQSIAKDEEIEFLFLKDEYDFNSGAAVPYSISPLNNLSHYCQVFYEKAQGVSDLGGLIMEEFLSYENKIEIFKSHVYQHVIPGEHLHYIVSLKQYQEGSLYEPLIEKIQEETTQVPQRHMDHLNTALSKYYPYIFSSVDYIFHDNRLKVIDLNSTAGSLGYVQQLDNDDDHNPFEFFLEQICVEDTKNAYQRQSKYQNMIFNLHSAIRDLGPSYINGDQVINLVDGSELNIEQFMDEFEV